MSATFKLVPVEPTEAMQHAFHNGPTSTHQLFRERYRNMVEAAPKYVSLMTDEFVMLSQAKRIEELEAKLAEVERLVILMEEMGEAACAASKVIRFGWKAVGKDGTAYDNRAGLHRELGDVRASMIRLCSVGDLNKLEIHMRADEKLAPGGTLLKFQKG